MKQHPVSAADLKSLDVLSPLPESSLDELVRLGHTKTFQTDEVIFRRGEAGDYLLLLLKGRVKIINTTTSAREIVLDFLGPGDVLGEIAALDGGPRTADAIACEPTQAFQIHRRDVLATLSRHPDVLLAIIFKLCAKLRTASGLAEERLLTMAGRCAAGLLRLARQHRNKAKDGTLIDLTVTQKDLGSYLGMSRENTSRHLGLLKTQGMIRMAGGRIVILDEAALEDLADQEPETQRR